MAGHQPRIRIPLIWESRQSQKITPLALYKQRHKIENMFAKLKCWRRVSTRTTDAPTHTSTRSVSLQPLSYGSINSVLTLVCGGAPLLLLLSFRHFFIDTTRVQKPVVGSSLDDPPVIENEDFVGMNNGR